MRPNQFLERFTQGSILPIRQNRPMSSQPISEPLIPKFKMIKTGGFKLKAQN